MSIWLSSSREARDRGRIRSTLSGGEGGVGRDDYDDKKGRAYMPAAVPSTQQIPNGSGDMQKEGDQRALRIGAPPCLMMMRSCGGARQG
jgi:hypothetical protein